MVDRDNLMDVARDVEHTALDPSDILLTDQVAVVTGGGGGIGQGIALGLARFGCDVRGDRHRPRAMRGDAGRRSSGSAVGDWAFPCDVMDTAGLVAAVDRVHAELGRLDILVNNAGGVRGGPFLTQPEASVPSPRGDQPVQHAVRDAGRGEAA